MHHGVICAGQTSWDAAEEARWKQDIMPELHNDDALWAFAMRASEEYCHRAHFQLHFCIYFFHPRRLSHTRLLFRFYEDTNCYEFHDEYVPQADYR